MMNAATIRNDRPHSFHIPIMGTGYTIDTPLKVAKYGIDSVISLVDDVMIEQMRALHCKQQGLTYEAISADDSDCRARRITAYLNLLDKLIKRDFEALRSSPFEPNSEITRYFHLLPEGPLKGLYKDMLAEKDEPRRAELMSELRGKIKLGRVDVNIMTKLDKNRPDQESKYSDASSALRGFANSTLNSRLVLSAGLNSRLYAYLASFEDFLPINNASPKKQIVLKVSDYRSALVQAKFLARSGIWIDEFRVETSVNCGGHTFLTSGQLIGPILEQFKHDRLKLYNSAISSYKKAITGRGLEFVPDPHRLTIQGGIGTSEEDRFLMDYYKADGTGWGTPFMLVPEVIRLEKNQMENLAHAGHDDVYLSASSPLGLPFWLLGNCTSNLDRIERIKKNNPGRKCIKGFAQSNTEFTNEPICTASRTYQKRKLASLENGTSNLLKQKFEREQTLAKICLCHDLAGTATKTLDIEPFAKTAICCGPNIVNFSKITTLDEMVDHIYGRTSLLDNHNRPHMLIRELELYVDLLESEVKAHLSGADKRKDNYFDNYLDNLKNGMEFYRQLADKLPLNQRKSFRKALTKQSSRIDFAKHKVHCPSALPLVFHSSRSSVATPAQ